MCFHGGNKLQEYTSKNHMTQNFLGLLSLNSSDLIGVKASAAARGKTRFPSLSNELVSPLIESSGDLAASLSRWLTS